MSLNKLLVVVGPTASGKSALALSLAQQVQGGILNGDSIQVYQRLDIGSAKPSIEDRQKVPHFLFDQIAPGATLTAAGYRREALTILERELPLRPMFLVGASGFYLRALLKGMPAVPPSDPALMAQLEADWQSDGGENLWCELTAGDPLSAQKLHRNDRYRILRALAVLRQSGVPLSEQQRRFTGEAFPFSYATLGLKLERRVLEERVRHRAKKMLELGLLEETQRLLEEGFGAWSPLGSVGYHECARVIRGELSRADLLEAIVTATLQLAKRQMTWFRGQMRGHTGGETSVEWFDADRDLAAAVDFARGWLK